MAGILAGNYDDSKVFLFGNQTQKISYTNSTGSAVTLPVGRLMGRKTSDQKLLPHVSTANDGSQQPIGVLYDTYVVANGATVDLFICDSGNVAREKVVLGGADTWATVITGDVSVESALARNSGVRLISSTELTAYDNAIP